MTMTTPEMKPYNSFAIAGVALALLVAAGCAGKPVPPAEPAEDGAGEGTVASGVNATVIVNKCPDAAHVNVKAAQDAIQRLVGPCASVPGGRAHFSATLQPGGNIVLASPEGNPAEGVVPTCVLKNRLSHRIPLKSPCALDVQLDERTVTVERPDAAPTGTASAAPVPTATARP